MVDPETWIENGTVKVSNGRISEVGKAGSMTEVMDCGSGVIMPALGNAHTHLSLSALKDRVETQGGFIHWIRELIRRREGLSPDEVRAAAMEAAQAMKRCGVGFAAEVGPLEPGLGALRRNRMGGSLLLECLGTETEIPDLPQDREMTSFGLAGHAVHTTSPGALKALKAASSAQGRLFGIHLAESKEEEAYLMTGRGKWRELMEERGHDCSHWKPWGERPIERACRLGLLDRKTLAVHLLETTTTDMETLARHQTKVCLCPRSNLALHGRYPDIEGFLKVGLNPAIGTDSLASTPSLSLFDEMRFIGEHYPSIRAEVIIGLATINAAHALNRHDMGSLRPENRASLIYVDIQANTRQEAAQELVFGAHERVTWL
jgi:cytosine/adenosine deaminase-related metal-dependent hydrolase